MTFKTKIFYESGTANEGGGGDNTSTETLEKTAEQQQQSTPAELPKPLLSDDELKGYGFDSPEALKTFLSKRKEENIAPEEKLAKENLEKASFLKFAAEEKDKEGNPLLRVEDFNSYETLKSKSDKDLVFEHFIEEFKTDNPDIKDPEELREAATEEFNYEYKLKDGASEAAKKKGETKLAREAKELRNPIENKVLAAQAEFKQQNDIRQTYPKFETFVDESIKRNTPDKLAIVKIKDGESEIPIEIELTKADREAMAKSFKTPKTFQLFTSGKPEDISAALDKKMSGWIKENKADEIAAKSFERGRGTGTKQGSTVGASNPFPLINNEPAKFTGEMTLEESNKNMAAARAKATGQR